MPFFLLSISTKLAGLRSHKDMATQLIVDINGEFDLSCMFYCRCENFA